MTHIRICRAVYLLQHPQHVPRDGDKNTKGCAILTWVMHYNAIKAIYPM